MSNGADISSLTIFEGGVLGASERVSNSWIRLSRLRPARSSMQSQRGLVPIACFPVDNIRFAFASSFIEPAIQAELVRLDGLLKIHPPASLAANASRPGSPLSVFGHADPTGDDEYNKILSGRRAQAVHALMIRDAASWNALREATWRGQMGPSRHQDHAGFPESRE